jgi:hypothetical protein
MALQCSVSKTDGTYAVKRFTFVSALCLAALAASAGPAAAAPPLTFSAEVRADQSVSLFTDGSACSLRPCGYTWIVDGVRAGRGRSLVVFAAPGCHTVVLRMTERTFRNPTPDTHRAARAVCIAADAAGTSEVGELSEIPADAPPSETAEIADTTDTPPDETDTAEDPPASAPPADTTTTPPPADTTTTPPPADTTTTPPPADTTTTPPPADTTTAPPVDATTTAPATDETVVGEPTTD